MPGYTVVDAGLRWTPLEPLRLDLHIYNMFNTIYAAAPYDGGTQWILGEPLAFEASATVRF
jgi:iron complex outermembrane receptor protein